MDDSDEEASREPPEELATWGADDGEEFFRGELLPAEFLPVEIWLEEPLVEAAARDPDVAERFLEEYVPEDRLPEEEELFFFAEDLPEEDLVAEPEEL